MAIKTVSLDSFVFPERVTITEEFGHSPIVQVQTFLATGALLIEPWEKQAGKPIQIGTGRMNDGYCGLFSHDEVVALEAMHKAVDAPMTLLIGEEATEVYFDRKDGSALKVEPLVTVAAGHHWPAGRVYSVTVKLLSTEEG